MVKVRVYVLCLPINTKFVLSQFKNYLQFKHYEYIYIFILKSMLDNLDYTIWPASASRKKGSGDKLLTTYVDNFISILLVSMRGGAWMALMCVPLRNFDNW